MKSETRWKSSVTSKMFFVNVILVSVIFNCSVRVEGQNFTDVSGEALNVEESVGVFRVVRVNETGTDFEAGGADDEEGPRGIQPSAKLVNYTVKAGRSVGLAAQLDAVAANNTESDAPDFDETFSDDAGQEASESQNFEKYHTDKKSDFISIDGSSVMAINKNSVLESTQNSVLNDHLKNANENRERLGNGDRRQEEDAFLAQESISSNVSSLEEILDVYNPHRLGRIWGRPGPQRAITNGCNATMATFLRELTKGTLWAQKMTDASGKYNTGFYWGNNYWAGSSTLCAFTGDPEAPALHSVPKSLSSTSPFPLGFYTMRLEITSTKEITPIGRSIHLGICLPLECTGEDVRQIVDLSAFDEAKSIPRLLTIANIRTPHENYDMTADPAFWVLMAFSACFFVLLFGGTVYDLYIQNTRASFLATNYTYEVTKAASIQPLGDKSYRPTIVGDAINNNIDIVDSKVQSKRYTDNGDSEAAVKSGHSADSNLCMFSKILLAFSVRRNLLTICDKSVGSDTLPTIHGLRSISMAWVILGHTCIVIFKFSDNIVFREVVETNILFQAIGNGAFSVDTFFFISALLVSFLYFRTAAKVDLAKLTKFTGFKSHIVQFVGMLLYRFARLTVPYMFVLGAVEITMKWFFFNSSLEAPSMDHENCPNYWWRNVLYINTLFPVDQMCMLWSWYLADDTQFYIIGSILLIVAVRNFRVAAISMAVFMVSSWFTTGYIAYINDHMPNLDDPLALFDKIYDKPWTRLGPYLVGMAVGWILFKTDCKIRMSKLTVTVGWVLSIACLLALVFGLYNANLHPLAAAAYSSLSHTAWALSLAWIVIACTTGYGGYINSLLSLPILYPFSRVTYCAYLIHPLMIRVMVMRIDSPLHLATNSVMIIFFGQVVSSYLMSFVISLSFEAPIVSLLRLLSPTKQKKEP